MQPELREPAARNTNQRGALLIQNTVKKAAKNSKFPPTNGIFEIYDLEISQHEVHTASAPPERVLSFATGWYSASVSNAGRRAESAKQLAFEELLYAGHGTADLSRKAAALYSATTANHFWRFALLALESEKFLIHPW